MRWIPPVAAILGFAWVSCASAQEQALPPDGWWVRYSRIAKQEIDGRPSESAQQITYSLAGTVVEDGEKCRWIEINTVGQKSNSTSKYLIPEKDLLESEQPLNTAKRGWTKKRDNGEVQAISIKNVAGINTETMIFPGIWQKSERVDKEKVVDYQQGRLTIPEARRLNINPPVNTGSVSGKNRKMKTNREYVAWFERTLAPVIAAATLKEETYSNEKLIATVVVDVVVEENGSGSKTKLPDNN